MKRIFFIAAAALLLSACTSTQTRDGMVYRDGSWYAPAEAGRGDYYTGASHEHDGYYDWPWAWSVGFVPYGGYCPVMYRYCTSFWADPFYGPAFPHYGYLSWPVDRNWPRRHGQRGVASVAEQEPVQRPARERVERSEPRTREGGAPWGGRRADGGETRPRRRGVAAGGGPE